MAGGGGLIYAIELADVVFEPLSNSYSEAHSAKWVMDIPVSRSDASTGVMSAAIGGDGRALPCPFRRSLLIWSISTLYLRSAAAISG